MCNANAFNHNSTSRNCTARRFNKMQQCIRHYEAIELKISQYLYFFWRSVDAAAAQFPLQRFLRLNWKPPKYVCRLFELQTSFGMKIIICCMQSHLLYTVGLGCGLVGKLLLEFLWSMPQLAQAISIPWNWIVFVWNCCFAKYSAFSVCLFVHNELSELHKNCATKIHERKFECVQRINERWNKNIGIETCTKSWN